jgi:hypothetical protein
MRKLDIRLYHPRWPKGRALGMPTPADTSCSVKSASHVNGRYFPQRADRWEVHIKALAATSHASRGLVGDRYFSPLNAKQTPLVTVLLNGSTKRT